MRTCEAECTPPGISMNLTPWPTVMLWEEDLRETSWWCEFASVCVSAAEGWEGAAPAILSKDDMSPFSSLTLKEPPTHTHTPPLFSFAPLCLSNKTDDMCKSQNTVPLKPFGCWQGPRRCQTTALIDHKQFSWCIARHTVMYSTRIKELHHLTPNPPTDVI